MGKRLHLFVSMCVYLCMCVKANFFPNLNVVMNVYAKVIAKWGVYAANTFLN